jgi:hypothetical protein
VHVKHDVGAFLTGLQCLDAMASEIKYFLKKRLKTINYKPWHST